MSLIRPVPPITAQISPAPSSHPSHTISENEYEYDEDEYEMQQQQQLQQQLISQLHTPPSTPKHITYSITNSFFECDLSPILTNSPTTISSTPTTTTTNENDSENTIDI